MAGRHRRIAGQRGRDRGQPHRRLRPHGGDARLQPDRSRLLPRNRPAGGIPRSAGGGGDGPGALRLGGAVQDSDLSRRLRLLRAGQHHRAHAREACRILAEIMREKALDTLERADLPVDRGQVRLLPGDIVLRGGRASRLADRLGRSRDRGGADRRLHAGWHSRHRPLGRGRGGPRLVQAGLGGGRSGARADWPTPATCSM